MATSALGDTKSYSGTEKCLEAKARALSKISFSIQSLGSGGFKSIMNRVYKLNKVQKSGECILDQRYLLLDRNIKKDRSRTNKCKVRMISSETSFPEPGFKGAS